ncbi:TonB-dependent receptor plug domain-containing protein [Klebsiella pneumoniae]|nr:TonB-dependent receptor plug domain-containing protein [Klebsiella pneumoniae]
MRSANAPGARRLGDHSHHAGGQPDRQPTSGQRGNNRQIDIRGMGPKNTPDPDRRQPVTSRNSVRLWLARRARHPRRYQLGAAGDIERIEADRGPVAARHGNGAAGGVVNIITKNRR